MRFAAVLLAAAAFRPVLLHARSRVGTAAVSWLNLGCLACRFGLFWRPAWAVLRCAAGFVALLPVLQRVVLAASGRALVAKNV